MYHIASVLLLKLEHVLCCILHNVITPILCNYARRLPRRGFISTLPTTSPFHILFNLLRVLPHSIQTTTILQILGQQTPPAHLFRLIEAHDGENGGRDVGQCGTFVFFLLFFLAIAFVGCAEFSWFDLFVEKRVSEFDTHR